MADFLQWGYKHPKPGISDDRFALLYGVEKNGEAESTCCKLIDSSGTVLQSNTLEKPFYCTSEPSISGTVLTWCHYMESGLGNFLIMNQWDLDTGSFKVSNLDTGMESKISEIKSISGGSYVPGQTYEVQMNVYSDLFQDQFPMAPVVWETSDPDIMEVLSEETMLSDSVWNHSYKVATTKIKVKTDGPATLTCRVGSKTGTLKLQAADPVKVTGVTLNMSSKALRVGERFSLVANLTPLNAANRDVDWQSMNKAIASVTAYGVVEAIGIGETTIRAITRDGGFIADCKVTVTEENKDQTSQTTDKDIVEKPAKNQVSGNKGTISAAQSQKMNKPKKVTLKKVASPKKRTLKLTWKRNSQATGYQAMVATDKKFKKNKKAALIKKNKTTTKTFKKLKKDKTYYAKVRAYKQYGKTKLYGSYSKAKKAKVK